MKKTKVAIIGPGNIGTDLMYKIKKSKCLELTAMIGVDESAGIKRARDMGVVTSTDGIRFVESNPNVAEIFFDATTATAHRELHAPVLERLNKIAIDLTPAAVGKIVSPMVNIEEALNYKNVNLITCGGQVSTPIVYAVSQVVPVEYAELVTTVSSKSVGPGTRKNIDEFTKTTAHALRLLGGAKRSRVLTLINPAVPEIAMRNAIYCVPDGSFELDEVIHSVKNMVSKIQEYVPGYTLTLSPKLENGVITTIISVTGAGDFLPSYAGNLDIETSSAVRIAELFVENQRREVKNNG